MANETIAQLPGASLPLGGTELAILWQGGVTTQTPVSNVINLVGTNFPSLTIGGQSVAPLFGTFTSGHYLQINVTAGVATIVDAGTAGSFSTLTTTGPYGSGVAALDLHQGTFDPAAYAIWIPGNVGILMNTDANNPASIRWDAGVGRWKFSYGGVDVASIDEIGTLRLAGLVLSGVEP